MSRGALACVAPICVGAGASPAQQGVLHTLVHVHAVLHQPGATLVAMETLTLKAAWGIDTGTLAAEVRGDVALVNVCAVPFLGVQGEAPCAGAAEAAHSVAAGAVCAEAGEGFALIHIFIEGLA